MIEIGIGIILTALVLISSFTDVRYKKILNLFTAPAIVLGMVLNTLNTGLSGFQNSILGFGLGVLLFLIPVLIGAMGAGDLKLMAAIGALKGVSFTLTTMIYSVVAGGVLILVYVAIKGRLKETLINVAGMVLRPLAKALYLRTGKLIFSRIHHFFDRVKSEKPDLYIPYGVPIAIGTILVLLGV